MGPGSAPALRGPTCSSPCWSTQAMLPPPAPTLRTSTEGKPVMWPTNRGPIQVSTVVGMRPLCTTLTS